MDIHQLLPEELWLQVFADLDFVSLNYTMPLVCRRFNELLLPTNTPLKTPETPSNLRARPFSVPDGKYALHPMLRKRFKILPTRVLDDATGKTRDVMKLVRLEHSNSYDTMQADAAAIAMVGATTDGWGEYDDDAHLESAVTPAVTTLLVELDPKKTHIIEISGDEDSDACSYDPGEEENIITVRDVLIAETDFCFDVLEGRMASFEQFKGNVQRQYEKEIAGVGSMTFWETGADKCPKAKRHVEKTKESYDRLRKVYLGPEERLYIALEDLKKTRVRGSEASLLLSRHFAERSRF